MTVARQLAETANRAATFEPMTADHERPAVTVAGVQVYAYADPETGQFRVSVDLDTAEPWLSRSDTDATIPLRITVSGDTVFTG